VAVGAERGSFRRFYPCNAIIIDGDTSNWPVQPKLKDGRLTYNNKDWNSVLGHLLFGLKVDGEEGEYQPKYRSLVS
jgi:uncharacterized protein YydD (DUF2326 family)